jgi:molybdenum cofactor cytidylyltransferase
MSTRIAAVILAAGGSQRLGAPKQLARLDGETLVERAARVASDAGFSPVVVVLGAQAEATAKALEEHDVQTVENPDWASGLASSIRCGVTAARVAAPAGIAILLADQPRVDAPLLRRLEAAFSQPGIGRSACRYAGEPGVPAIFGPAHWDALEALSGDRGAKALLADAGSDRVLVDSDAPALDIDTLEAARAAGVQLPLPDEVRQLLEAHSRSFLLSLRRDGSPSAHPMTALQSTGHLVFNTYRKSAKARNIERDPRVSAILLNGYATADLEEVEGFSIQGRGMIRAAARLPQVRADAGQVSEAVKERTQSRIAAGKRILVHVEPESIQPLERG